MFFGTFYDFLERTFSVENFDERENFNKHIGRIGKEIENRSLSMETQWILSSESNSFSGVDTSGIFKGIS